MKLADLKPCATGLASARESRTLRDAWDVASRNDLIWLIGKAHTVGTLPRRALVLVACRCVETVAHLITDDSLPHLATVSSWANGADDVSDEDLREAREALLAGYRAAYACHNAIAAYAAYAAAADAATYAADADVIRDAITMETVCSALGLDPDEVL